MFGPGPSNVPPRILAAGAEPIIGHMHPEMLEVGLQNLIMNNQSQLKVTMQKHFYFYAGFTHIPKWLNWIF